MTTTVEQLTASLAALIDAWGFGDVSGMSDAALLDANARVASLKRQLDGLHVRIAGEISSRSRPELGREGLARKSGHRTPAHLIASVTGGHPGDASQLVQVGEATRGRVQFSGEIAPPRYPVIAAAVAAGRLSVAAACAISGMLDRIAARVSPTVRADAEQALVEHAAVLSLHELQAVLRRAEATLDPDGVTETIDELRSARALRIRRDANGMIHLDGRFDPETGAPIVAAIDALVTQQLRTSRGHNVPGTLGGDTPTTVDAETRTIPQMNADALAAISRHALGCANSDVPTGTTTVVVRVDLETLKTGLGTAIIDGIEQPIDAAAARRLASAADIIPCVLGGESEILDWGRAKRHFTKAQRLALVERDGGCAFCHLPPQYTEAHHLDWWSRDTGTTDLDNGILLCTSCHHRIHDEGWGIEIAAAPPGEAEPPHHRSGSPASVHDRAQREDSAIARHTHATRLGTRHRVTFIPPAHIDPTRTPRTGGRYRFDPMHWRLTA